MRNNSNFPNELPSSRILVLALAGQEPHGMYVYVSDLALMLYLSLKF